MNYQKLRVAFPRKELGEMDINIVWAIVEGWNVLLSKLLWRDRLFNKDIFLCLDGKKFGIVEFTFFVPKTLAISFAYLIEAIYVGLEIEVIKEFINKADLCRNLRKVRVRKGNGLNLEVKTLPRLWNVIWQSKTVLILRLRKRIFGSYTISLYGKNIDVVRFKKMMSSVWNQYVGPLNEGTDFLLKNWYLLLFLFPGSGRLLENKRYIEYEIPKRSLKIDKTVSGEVFLGDLVSRKLEQEKLCMNEDMRARHFYVVGRTGVGKSTFLLGKILADMQKGNGLCVMDPHGDLIEAIIARVPKNRTNDVVYFDPAKTEGCLPINFFTASGVDNPDLIVSNLLAVFKRLFSFSWGPRLEYILRLTLMTLMELKVYDLHMVIRLLTDEKYLKSIIPKIKSNTLKNFWMNEFLQISMSKRSEWIAPILNKVGQIISIPQIDKVLSSEPTNFLPRKFMDEKKIVLCNLSKGLLGDDVSQFLGAILVSLFQMAAMSRANIPEAERVKFTMYIDEFQNFATDTFGSILSEARKYKLQLVLAHQYLEQLDSALLAAIFGNVGSLMSFQLGPHDANYVSKYFGSVSEESFVSLPRFHAYVSLYSGDGPQPFLLKTLPVRKPASIKKLEKVISQSWQRYGR